MKTCARCGESKSLDDFSKDARAGDGRYSACKGCCAAAAKAKREADPTASRAAVAKWKKANPEAAARHIEEWHDRNPESHLKSQRKYDLKRRGGESPELPGWYTSEMRDRMSCAICGASKLESRDLHLDHCHKTGKVRDFLCGTCNRVLGLFGDDPDRFISAAQYLMRHQRTLEGLLPNLMAGKGIDDGE